VYPVLIEVGSTRWGHLAPKLYESSVYELLSFSFDIRLSRFLFRLVIDDMTSIVRGFRYSQRITLSICLKIFADDVLFAC
jgi:hypothetical protein